MVAQRHDAMYKLVLSVPANVASLLRAVLPPELIARLDLEHLRLVPGSFVDEDLRQRHSDILMRTRLRGDDGDGRVEPEVLVYCLIEHQSRPDPLMPLRILEYLVKIWRRHTDRHASTTALPMVLPVVLYQGDEPWEHSTELLDLIDVDPTTAELAERFLPRFEFALDDETEVDVEQLRRRPFTRQLRATVRMGQVIRTHTYDVTVVLDGEDIQDLRGLQEEDGGQKVLHALLAYILSGSKTPMERLAEFAAQVGPETRELVVTTAEQLEARGQARGRLEEAARLLKRLLARKFGPVPDRLLARVDAAPLEQLETWSDLIIDATTLDDVFA